MNYVWTNQRPTRPGFYWFRGSPSEPADDWCVFQIWEDEGMLIVSYRERQLDEMMRKWPRGQWSSTPIEEPQ